jgi:hypothetical protein
MADVFTVLGQDHLEVKRMLAELGKWPTRVTGASEDQVALGTQIAQGKKTAPTRPRPPTPPSPGALKAAAPIAAVADKARDAVTGRGD